MKTTYQSVQEYKKNNPNIIWYLKKKFPDTTVEQLDQAIILSGVVDGLN